MKSVWVVSHGEKHQGDSVLKIFGAKDKALDYAKYITASLEPWKLVEDSKNRVVWESGCDRKLIERFAVN